MPPRTSNASSSCLIPAGLAAVATCLASARDVHADPRPSGRVEVTRAPDAMGCPDSAALQAAVDWAGLVDPSPQAIALDVAFERKESGYVATVQVPERQATRTLVSEARDCSALADAVVVAINVMLDSAADDAGAEGTEPTQEPAAAPAPASEDVLATSDAVPWPAPEHYEDQSDVPHRTAPNIVFAEIFGAGMGYSVNYERFFGDDASLRIGFSYARGTAPDPEPIDFNAGRFGYIFPRYTQLSLPLLANYYYLGHPNHNLHFAGGATFLYRTGPIDDAWYSPFGSGYGEGNFEAKGLNMTVDVVVGYRYVPRAGGVTIGADFLVMFNTIGAVPWVGANLGWAF